MRCDRRGVGRPVKRSIDDALKWQAGGGHIKAMMIRCYDVVFDLSLH